MLSAFGRAISEVGAVMIVGGNIDHYTRVMTTAISLETRMGNLEYAMALGIVLIVLTTIIYSIVYIFNIKKRRTNPKNKYMTSSSFQFIKKNIAFKHTRIRFYQKV